MDAVINLIATACLFSSPNVSKQYKLDCMEKLVNCSVGPGGLVTEKQTKECIKKERAK